MKDITPDLIEQVRNNAKIVDVVSASVVLQKKGKDFSGLCPFHDEKSPSFFVNVEKNRFKCFGCSEGGDVITFVQKRNHLNFVDSVRLLAQTLGLPLDE